MWIPVVASFVLLKEKSQFACDLFFFITGLKVSLLRSVPLSYVCLTVDSFLDVESK